MDIFWAITAILCGIIGILGAVVPILPGTLLSFAGMICACLTSTSDISSSQLWLWGVISIIIIVLDYILPGYFSKMFGGSKAGVTGATIGVIAGRFFGPIGIIIGPFVGAFMGATKDGMDNTQALKAGFGSLLGFLFGTVLKFVVCGYFAWVFVRELLKLLEALHSF